MIRHMRSQCCHLPSHVNLYPTISDAVTIVAMATTSYTYIGQVKVWIQNLHDNHSSLQRIQPLQHLLWLPAWQWLLVLPHMLCYWPSSYAGTSAHSRAAPPPAPARAAWIWGPHAAGAQCYLHTQHCKRGWSLAMSLALNIRYWQGALSCCTIET